MRNVLSYVNKFNSLYLRSVLLALTRNAIGTTETAKVLEIFRVLLGNLPRCGILAPQAIRQRRSGDAMVYRHTIDATAYVFDDLRDLLAKATPLRSGDRLAGLAADSAEQMVAARMALADVPLARFLNETVIPYEEDEVTRLIVDCHDASAFAPVAALTVAAFRDWLLSDAASCDALRALSRGITPEMAAAVSK